MKKGKAGTEKEVTKETTCNEDLVECHPIPEELNYFSVWKPELVKAFLRGQDSYSLRDGFLGDMQKVLTALMTKICDLERKIERKNERRDKEEDPVGTV